MPDHNISAVPGPVASRNDRHPQITMKLLLLSQETAYSPLEITLGLWLDFHMLIMELLSQEMFQSWAWWPVPVTQLSGA